MPRTHPFRSNGRKKVRHPIRFKCLSGEGFSEACGLPEGMILGDSWDPQGICTGLRLPNTAYSSRAPDAHTRTWALNFFVGLCWGEEM